MNSQQPQQLLCPSPPKGRSRTLANHSSIFSGILIKQMCPKSLPTTAEHVGFEQLHLVSKIRNNRILCFHPVLFILYSSPQPHSLNKGYLAIQHFLGIPWQRQALPHLCASILKGTVSHGTPQGAPWSVAQRTVFMLSLDRSPFSQPSFPVLCGTDLATVQPDFRLWGWACCSRSGLTETVLGLEAGSLSHGDFSKVNRIIQDGVGRFILRFRKEVGGRGTQKEDIRLYLGSVPFISTCH